jgi:hypothetical protein
MSSNSQVTSGSRFLALPAELRIKIYDIALAPPLICNHVNPDYIGLYHSCRRIQADIRNELIRKLKRVKTHAEAITALYTFSLDIPDMKSPPNVNAVRLNVHFPKGERRNSTMGDGSIYNGLHYPYGLEDILAELQPLFDLGLETIEVILKAHPEDCSQEPDPGCGMRTPTIEIAHRMVHHWISSYLRYNEGTRRTNRYRRLGWSTRQKGSSKAYEINVCLVLTRRNPAIDQHPIDCLWYGCELCAMRRLAIHK